MHKMSIQTILFATKIEGFTKYLFALLGNINTWILEILYFKIKAGDSKSALIVNVRIKTLTSYRFREFY